MKPSDLQTTLDFSMITPTQWGVIATLLILLIFLGSMSLFLGTIRIWSHIQQQRNQSKTRALQQGRKKKIQGLLHKTQWE